MARERKDTVTRTVRITRKQAEWIKENHVSISLLVQDFIDRAVQEKAKLTMYRKNYYKKGYY